MSDAISSANDGLGAAGAFKYGAQSARAAVGLPTTTRLTAAFDLASGSVGVAAAGDVGDAAKGVSTLGKGATGAVQFSNVARIANFASAAAPVVAKGSAVLTGALGAVDVVQGVQQIQQGKTSQGTDQVIAGSADIVTSVALGVAATSSASVVGVPVAAVALGVAGIAQGVKYRHQIGDAARAVGNHVGQGAQFVGERVAQGARAVASNVKSGVESLTQDIGGLFD